MSLETESIYEGFWRSHSDLCIEGLSLFMSRHKNSIDEVLDIYSTPTNIHREGSIVLEKFKLRRSLVYMAYDSLTTDVVILSIWDGKTISAYEEMDYKKLDYPLVSLSDGQTKAVLYKKSGV